MRRLLSEIGNWVGAALILFALLFFLLMGDAIWQDYRPEPAGEPEAQDSP